MVSTLLWVKTVAFETRQPQFMYREGFESFVFEPLIGAILGFVGALIFLGTAFSFVKTSEQNGRVFMVAGALAGMTHSAVGLGLLWIDRLTWKQGDWLQYLIENLAFIGGFILLNSPPIVATAASISASAAGAVAGYVYWKVLGVGTPGAE